MYFHITDLPSHSSHSINMEREREEGGREGNYYYTVLVKLASWGGHGEIII